MILLFTLSMPSNNAWNGKWSGAERNYTMSHNFGKTQKAEARATKILERVRYYHNFGDGWTAAVSVREVTAKEATAARKKSDGFCGYEWMVKSILRVGEIET